MKLEEIIVDLLKILESIAVDAEYGSVRDSLFSEILRKTRYAILLAKGVNGHEYGGTPQQKLQAKGLRAIAQELKDRANNVKVGSE
jgi:hypothetical protein